MATAFERTELDLERIAERDKPLSESAMAGVALQMAAELDDPSNSATSKSMCAKQLAETMDRLWELAPEAPARDGVDELQERRRERRAS